MCPIPTHDLTCFVTFLSLLCHHTYLSPVFVLQRYRTTRKVMLLGILNAFIILMVVQPVATISTISFSTIYYLGLLTGFTDTAGSVSCLLDLCWGTLFSMYGEVGVPFPLSSIETRYVAHYVTRFYSG